MSTATIAASVREAAAGGPLVFADLAAFVDRAAAARRASGLGARMYREYTQYCAEYGNSPPLPLTPSGLLSFALCRCLRGVSTVQLDGAVTALRRHAEDEGLSMSGWGAGAARRISSGIKALERDFPAEIIRAAPMTDGVMRRVLAYLQPFIARGDRYALMWRAMMTLAYSQCLRSGEFLGGKMVAEHVRVADGRLVLLLPFRKANGNVLDLDRDLVTTPSRSAADADLDPRRAVEAYAEAAGITLGEGDTPLFVRRRRGKGGGDEWPETGGGYSYAAALRELRWLLSKAGVADAGSYSWHSFRRGMATQLLELGVPWDVVKKLGGWASDTAMASYDARGHAVAVAVEALRAAPSPPGAGALGRRRDARGGGARGGRGAWRGVRAY